MDSVKAKIEEGSQAQASLDDELKAKDADIKTLQASFISRSCCLLTYRHSPIEHSTRSVYELGHWARA